MLSQEQQIFEQIKKSNAILITFSKLWNGDTVASALALFLLLKKMDKTVDIVADKSEQGKIYGFLPSFSVIGNSLNNLRKFIVSVNISNAKVGQIKYKIEDQLLNFIIAPKEGFFTKEDISSRSGDFKYDLIITVDTPDLESLGFIYDNDTEFFYKCPVVNIDHHANNEGFGQINHVELTATSTAEIIFELLSHEYREFIDEDIATCLLAGIISKTRNFKTPNISPQALSFSSQLIAMGARREDIVNRLYRSRSLGVLKLWGRVLARLTSSMDSIIVWSVLTRVDFEKTETTEDDVNDVIDELVINIPQAKIMMIIYEAREGDRPVTRILLSTTRNISAMRLAKEYNPIGSKNVVKITIPKGIQEAEKEFVDMIKAKAENLPI
jgi:bifunctional oligoribonuclease and PAP phosphatase NrnA